MTPKVDWFSRGQDAYTEGRPCFIRDARISSKDRAAWYDGWHHQARLNSASLRTDSERADLIAAFGRILDAVRQTP